MARKPYPKRRYPMWAELDPSIDRLLAEGWNVTDIAKDLGLKPDTVRAHLRARETSGTPSGHQGTPDHSGVPQEHRDLTEEVVKSYAAHPDTPEHTESLPEEQYTQEHLGTLPDAEHTEVHHGTLEGHQEVMEDISQSVPDVPHISTEEVHQSAPEHPSTPEVHQELSIDDSSMAHPGVPARQEHLISTPMVHPGTPSQEDWDLWERIKERWEDMEMMLSIWHFKTLRHGPRGTPRHTMKKTYVVDSIYVDLIDRYAKDTGVEIKDVVNAAFKEFFARRGDLSGEDEGRSQE